MRDEEWWRLTLAPLRQREEAARLASAANAGASPGGSALQAGPVAAKAAQRQQQRAAAAGRQEAKLAADREDAELAEREQRVGGWVDGGCSFCGWKQQELHACHLPSQLPIFCFDPTSFAHSAPVVPSPPLPQERATLPHTLEGFKAHQVQPYLIIYSVALCATGHHIRGPGALRTREEEDRRSVCCRLGSPGEGQPCSLLLFTSTVYIHTFCLSSQLDVNLAKTKIVIFNPPRSPTPDTADPPSPATWHFGDSPVTVSDSYRYLGITFHNIRGLTMAPTHLHAAGQRALHALYLRCTELGITTPSLMCRLFDSLISPVLSYAAEVWSFAPGASIARDAAETLHRRFLRRIAGMHPTTLTAATYAEFGRTPSPSIGPASPPPTSSAWQPSPTIAPSSAPFWQRSSSSNSHDKTAAPASAPCSNTLPARSGSQPPPPMTWQL